MVSRTTRDFWYVISQAVSGIPAMRRVWSWRRRCLGARRAWSVLAIVMLGEAGLIGKCLMADPAFQYSESMAATSGERPEQDVPPWMSADYDVWYRDPRLVAQNMLSNPDFDSEIDYQPYKEYVSGDNRRYSNLFSGDWAWNQAVCNHHLSDSINAYQAT